MKTAKKNKILILFSVLILSLIAAFSFMPRQVSHAAVSASEQVSTYFSLNDEVVSASFEDDAVKFSVKEGATIQFKNELAVNNFGISFTLTDEIKEITLNIPAKARLYNGNKNIDGGFDTEIDNVLTVNKDGTVKFNGTNESADVNNDLEINFSKYGSVLKATIYGVDLSNTDAYYELNTDDLISSKILITVSSVDGEDAADLKLNFVDQNVGVDGYKQTFVQDESGEFELATPRVNIKSSNFFNVIEGVNYVRRFFTYTITDFEVLSVFGKESSSNYHVSGISGSEVDVNGANGRDITFRNEDGDMAFLGVFDNADNQIETYSVVVKEDADSTPEYKIHDFFDQNAYDAYKAALLKATFSDEEQTKYIEIGSDKKIVLPTMKDLVKDDITSYENLTYTVQYWTPSTYSTSSTMTIPVTEAGIYKFCVLFTDGAGNSMENEDFYTVDHSDSTKFTVDGIYKDYFFEFELLDNADMTVTAGTQGNGYVGVKYKASAFTINASSYSTTYKLYYSANDIDVTADGWTEILPASRASEADTETESDKIIAIDYDGELTFTPDKVGYYKIVCLVSSENSARTVSAATKITVENQPKTVVPDSHWAQNNIASIIFLSIGGLSLLGIIVLIFVKPKDEQNVVSKKKK